MRAATTAAVPFVAMADSTAASEISRCVVRRALRRSFFASPSLASRSVTRCQGPTTLDMELLGTEMVATQLRPASLPRRDITAPRCVHGATARARRIHARVRRRRKCVGCTLTATTTTTTATTSASDCAPRAREPRTARALLCTHPRAICARGLSIRRRVAVASRGHRTAYTLEQIFSLGQCSISLR